MAQSSFGWQGTISEVQWAQLGGIMGHGTAVAALGDCAVSQVAGTRAVSIAAGGIFGDGVLTTVTSAESVALPTPTNGQWFLLVLERVWSTKATRFVLRNGATTATATSGNVPASFPASKLSAPGSSSDVPVAWLWGNSTGTAVTIVPLLRPTSSVRPRRGTAAERDALYGVPSTPAAQNYLQGSQWFNTELGYQQQYVAPYDATLNTGGDADAPGWQQAVGPSRRYYWQEQTETTGGILAGGGSKVQTERLLTVPTGRPGAVARVRAQFYLYQASTNNMAGNLVLLVDGVQAPKSWRFHTHGRAGFGFASGFWDVPLAAGQRRLQLRILADGASASGDVWDFDSTMAVEW